MPIINNNIPDNRFPYAFFFAAIIIRLSGFGTSAIWYDEAISRFRAGLPLINLITDFSFFQKLNIWELVLRPFSHSSLWILRLPSFICSIASLYVAWLLMETLKFTKKQQIIAWLPLITLPGLIWMAQDARYYSAISMLYMLGLLASLTRRIWLLVLVSILLGYIHPVGMVYSIAYWCIFFIDSLQLKKLWLLLIVGLAWFPRLWDFHDAANPVSESLSTVKTFWINNFDLYFIFKQTLLAISADTLRSRFAVIVLAIVTIVIFMALFKMRERSVRTISMATILPLIGMLIISIIWQPIYFYRTAQPFIPVLCLLVGLIINPNKRWYSWILPTFGIIILIVAIGNWDPTSRGGRLDDAAEFIKNNWQEGDILYYGSGTAALPFDYYLNGKPSYIIDAKLNLNITWPGIPFPSARLEDLEFSRAWVIFPQEPQIDSNDMTRLNSYTSNGTLIWRNETIHFAPIMVWLVNSDNFKFNQ